MHAFLNFLHENVRRISEIETAALKHLHEAGDEAAYRDSMRTKAKLLASLAANAAPHLDDLPLEVRPMIEHRLDMFAQSAQRSLDIGSVFYMSALLYPDDHQPGQPNNLEIWLAELKRNTPTL